MRRVVGCLVLFASIAACTGGPPPSSPQRPLSRPPGTGTDSSRPSEPPIVDPHNPVVPGFWPLSVVFWNGDRGLLAGKIYACEGCERSVGAVAVTRDGGATWHLVYRGASQVDDLSVVSERLAWATLDERHPRIITSRDSGATWRVVAGSDGLSNATFSAGGDGWAVSSYGRNLVRWNGSEWARMRDPCSAGEIVDISFPQSGEGTGWLACSWGAGAGQELKGVFETRDGGSSWDSRTLVRPDEASLSVGKGLGGYGYLQAISFQPDGSGWLVESRGTFFSTVDGGSTWHGHPKFQEPEIDFGADAWRVDRALGFALIDRRGMVLHVTTDGGDTWERIVSFRSP